MKEVTKRKRNRYFSIEAIMKLLSKDILTEYGFTENISKSNDTFEVMSIGNFDIRIKNGNYFYTILGIDYPLKDLAGLRKFYKENKGEELRELKF